MNFTSQHLSFNNKIPQHDDFLCFRAEPNFRYSRSETAAYHQIQTELTDDYFWLYSNYGYKHPRPSQVINTKNGISHDNLRTEAEVEPTEQLFMLYSFADNIMYISNVSNKGFVSNLLTDKMGLESIEIKNIFVDREQFIRQLQILDEIKFTSAKRDLFSGINTVGGALMDNYGMEEPEIFTVSAKYKTPMSKKVKNTLAFLAGQKTQGNITKLMIIGRDDQNIEQVFNEQAFTQKVSISVPENAEGLFEPDQVKTKLLEKLTE